MKNLIYITVLISLTACASMPLSSMWKLRNLDMLTTNPQDIRIAVVSNELVQLQDGSATITISFNSQQTEHNFETKLITNIDRNAQPRNLEVELEVNQAITLFYLSDEQAQQLKLAQSRILAIRDQGVEGDGSLSIDINTGCFSAPPPRDLPTDIFMQFDSQQGFIKMQSNLDLMQIARRAEQEFWFECETEQATQ